MSILGRFITYYKPQKKLFILDMVCAFFIAAMDLVFPLISENFINDYIPNRRLTPMFVWAGILAATYLLKLGAQYIVNYWGHVMGTRMEANMRSDLFKHLQTLPFSYYDENKTGQIMSRLVGDLRDIGEMAHHGPEDLFLSVIMLGGSFVFLIRTYAPLTIIIFIVLIFLVIFAMKKRSQTISTFRAVRRSHAAINEKLASTISGIRLCKSFANEDIEIDQFENRNRNYRESYKAAYKQLAEYSSGTKFLLEILNLLVIVIGGYYVYLGEMNYGQLVAFLLYTAFFVKPIERLVQFTQQYQSGIAGFERFVEIMDIESEINDAQNAVELNRPKGLIEFRDVSFTYGGNHDYVLKNFNLTIEPGKKIALVGPSGVGKTTVSHLIPRFYDVTSGGVFVDGIDIRDISQFSLRKNIGFVQQDMFIFFGTIRENILYGQPDASDEEIIWAAKQAEIHEFVMSLPNNYESIVGERGVKLSGGQKQRVALARVFLKNPPILVLDEATSSLDNTTELAIQKAIDLLAEERSALIIAHRLSTIKNADEIIVLADDGIAERGTHEELLKKNKLYAQLFKAQFGSILEDEMINRYLEH